MRRADHLFQIVLLLGRGRALTARAMDENCEGGGGKNLADCLRLAQGS